MAANSYSEFTQKSSMGPARKVPPTGKRGKRSMSTPYRCPSWGNSVKAGGVGWGADTAKVKVHPKSKGLATG